MTQENQNNTNISRILKLIDYFQPYRELEIKEKEFQ